MWNSEILYFLLQKEDSKGSDEGLEMVTKKKKKKKGQSEDDDEMDMESLDWWSKYFASVETMIRVSRLASAESDEWYFQWFKCIEILLAIRICKRYLISPTPMTTCLAYNVRCLLDTLYI